MRRFAGIAALIACHSISAEPIRPAPMPSAVDFYVQSDKGVITGCELVVTSTGVAASGTYAVQISTSQMFPVGSLPGVMLKVTAYKYADGKFSPIAIKDGFFFTPKYNTTTIMRRLGQSDNKVSQLYAASFVDNVEFFIELPDVIQSRPYIGFNTGEGADKTFRMQKPEDDYAFMQFSQCSVQGLRQAASNLPE